MKILKISKKVYILFHSIYATIIMLGMFSHNAFVPTQGYKTFSYLFIWILSILIITVSFPFIKEKVKKTMIC